MERVERVLENMLSPVDKKKEFKGLTETEFVKKYSNYDSASKIMGKEK